MGKRKSPEEFEKELEEISNGNLSAIDTYCGDKHPIKIYCNTCKKTFTSVPNRLLKGNGCPYCAGNKLLSTQEYKERFNEVSNGEYELLSDYINSRTSVTVLHKPCGHVYQIAPLEFLKETKCSKCLGLAKKTTKDFKEEVKELVGNEYKVLGKYINNKTKVLMRHERCGHEFLVSPNKFLSDGTRCPKCCGTHIWTTEEFGEYVKEKTNGEYSVLSEYVNARTKLWLKHEKCGNIYESTPQNFMKGCRCPNCYHSGGEDLIQEILNKKCIQYYREYKIEDCKNIKPLPFDFAIFKNGKILGLIEYDGRQHFEAVDFFGGTEGFEIRKKNDKTKDEYCETHNIPLLRIPYTYVEDKVDKSVEEFLNKIGAVE